MEIKYSTISSYNQNLADSFLKRYMKHQTITCQTFQTHFSKQAMKMLKYISHQGPENLVR